jgi:lysophospholipase L1-like esterase
MQPVADPEGRFDQPVSYVHFFNAGTMAPAAALRSPRYYDVSFPVADFSGKKRWRQGGIVRQHGPGDPRVVVLGSSHALMYSGVVDRICEALKIPAVFLGVDATPAFFLEDMGSEIGSRADGVHFNAIRSEVIRKWRPPVVVVADRWDGMADREQFERRLAEMLELVKDAGGRLVFVAQVPVIGVGDSVNLREIASSALRDGQGLPSLLTDERQSIRNDALEIAERISRSEPALIVIRTDDLLMDDGGAIRYLDGRRFRYIDDDHLSEAGADVVRPRLEAAIRGALAAPAE